MNSPPQKFTARHFFYVFEIYIGFSAILFYGRDEECVGKAKQNNVALKIKSNKKK